MIDVHPPAYTGVLVIGAGEAGLGVATELRNLGYHETITLLGDEPYLPYQRPPLSKGFLAGTEDEESLTLRAPEFLDAQQISVWPGRRVLALDLDDTGGTATLDDASLLRFDRLALTTGAVSRALPVPGAELAGVYSLRTIHDAIQLRTALQDAARLVVIGGGFIGLEVAAGARARGLTVTVVEASTRLLERVCAPPLSDYCLREHRAAGIEILLDAAVVELIGDERRTVTGVRLADGSTLPADLVIVGVGAIPTIELAEKAGLNCRRGIVVDAAGRTTHPRVVAAGDCTEQPHPHRAEELFGLESVNNAAEQAKAAAHALLDLHPPPRGVPWFWSDQAGQKIQIAGVSHGYDEYVVRPETGRLTVLYFRQRQLIAADVVNNPRDYMAVKRVLGHSPRLDPARAGDIAVPLKDILREAG